MHESGGIILKGHFLDQFFGHIWGSYFGVIFGVIFGGLGVVLTRSCLEI